MRISKFDTILESNDLVSCACVGVEGKKKRKEKEMRERKEKQRKYSDVHS
jgi:hypothetical protein